MDANSTSKGPIFILYGDWGNQGVVVGLAPGGGHHFNAVGIEIEGEEEIVEG